MADKKISQLSAAATPLAGTEVLPIVQSGATVKVSVANLTAGRTVTAADISAGLGAAGTPAYTFTGDTNTGMWSPAADTIAFSEGGVEAMRLNASGNVGIGTSSPSSYGRLSVNGNIVLGPLTRNQATTQSVGVWTTGDPADDGRANIGFTTVAGGASSSSVITFSTNNYGVSGGERMRIDSSGNVGIGTSSPNAAARLDVSSTTSGFLPPRMTTAQRDAIGSPPNGLMLYNTTTDKLQVRAAGSWVDLH
jgi:hypothetical protein